MWDICDTGQAFYKKSVGEISDVLYTCGFRKESFFLVGDSHEVGGFLEMLA